MFTKEDFKIESIDDLLEFAPVFVFVGLVAPFVLVAYHIGFVLNLLGLIHKPAD